MKIIGYDEDERLMAVEFATIKLDGYHGRTTDDQCRLYLGGYTYSCYYIIIRKRERKDGTFALTKKEAEDIVKNVFINGYLDLCTLGKYKIISETQWETVYVRNDSNDFTGEDIPVLISISDE